MRDLTAATTLEDWIDYAIRSDYAPYGLAQFDNLAQKTRLSKSSTEKENTQDAVKAEEEIRHGNRQDQEIATRGSRLRAATLGSRPSLLVSASRVRRKDAPGS